MQTHQKFIIGVFVEINADIESLDLQQEGKKQQSRIVISKTLKLYQLPYIQIFNQMKTISKQKIMKHSPNVRLSINYTLYFYHIAKNFQIYEQSEKYYSYANQQRFYQVLRKSSQLQKLLLSKHSLETLERQSRQYKKMIWVTILGSTILLYPFNKFIRFGSGFISFFIKLVCNTTLIVAPSIYINIKMKQRMIKVKKKVFFENRPVYRRFELSGDLLQICDDIELVEE